LSGSGEVPASGFELDEKKEVKLVNRLCKIIITSRKKIVLSGVWNL
jgi:hypothetical protein